MARIAVYQRSCGRVKYAVEDGDELVSVRFCQDTMIDGTQYALRLRGVFRSVGADEDLAQGHEQRRSCPFVHHVCHQDAQSPIRQEVEVVEIAGRLSGRFQQNRPG